MIRDLGYEAHFTELGTREWPELLSDTPPADQVLHGIDFRDLLVRVLARVPDADTYFYCLATLQKSRLKYKRIIECQPVPTMDQVGPRALLQFGHMSPSTLAGFLLWRKWLFDIDNRAGQETGYLFEPIIAKAIGGVSYSAKGSPIRRRDDPNKGRQVDCIKEDVAYEFKVRVTIAASGQGRWGEELAFPEDCRASSYRPILVVLDPTQNSKLDELVRAFQNSGGDAYVGDAAWTHLDDAAGHTMAVFLEKYVRTPIAAVLASTPEGLPDISMKMTKHSFIVEIDSDTVELLRDEDPPEW